MPWAHRERDKVLVRARLADAEVAVDGDGRGTIPTSTPRRYPHPETAPVPARWRQPSTRPTTTGTTVSAWRYPSEWHAFLGWWQLRPRAGYVLLDNHGVIIGEPPELGDDAFTQELRRIGHDGSLQLRETRAISWSASVSGPGS